MSPAVSVVVRTQDRPRFLRRALENISEQEHRDFEVVLVNDAGAPDPVNELVAEFRPALPKIRVLHRERSSGMEAASNAGLAASDSEFVAIHDDDDLWEPQFLARTVAALQERGDQMAVTRVDVYRERATADGYAFVASEPFWGELTEVSVQDLFRINRVVPIAILHRRSLHEELGPYDESLAAVGDWEFNLRVAARYPIVMVDELLAHWSHREEAEGAEANSVYAARAAHARFDARVRAREIRKDLEGAGSMGPYLYSAHLAGESEGRDARTHALLEDLRREVLQASRRLEELERRVEESERRGLRIERALSLRERIRGALGRAR